MTFGSSTLKRAERLIREGKMDKEIGRENIKGIKAAIARKDSKELQEFEDLFDTFEKGSERRSFKSLRGDAVAFSSGEFGRSRTDVHGQGPDEGLLQYLRAINSNPDVATFSSDSGKVNPFGFVPKGQKAGNPYLVVGFRSAKLKESYSRKLRAMGYAVDPVEHLENGVVVSLGRENATPMESDEFWESITFILSNGIPTRATEPLSNLGVPQSGLNMDFKNIDWFGNFGAASKPKAKARDPLFDAHLFDDLL